MIYLTDKKSGKLVLQCEEDAFSDSLKSMYGHTEIEPPKTKPYERLYFRKGRWVVKSTKEGKRQYIVSQKRYSFENLQNIFNSKITKVKKIAIEKPYMNSEAVDTQYEIYQEMYRQALKDPSSGINKAIIAKHEAQANKVYPYILQINNLRSEIEKMVNNLTDKNIDSQVEKIQSKLKEFKELNLDEV